MVTKPMILFRQIRKTQTLYVITFVALVAKQHCLSVVCAVAHNTFPVIFRQRLTDLSAFSTDFAHDDAFGPSATLSVVSAKLLLNPIDLLGFKSRFSAKFFPLRFLYLF